MQWLSNLLTSAERFIDKVNGWDANTMSNERFISRPRRGRKKAMTLTPPPTDYIDAINLHLEGKWPLRRLTELEWAVLVFMGLHDSDTIFDAWDSTFHGGEGTGAAEVVPGRPNEWYGLTAPSNTAPDVRYQTLFQVLPFHRDKATHYTSQARTFMLRLERLYLVERNNDPHSYLRYRLTPFGRTYIGPLAMGFSGG